MVCQIFVTLPYILFEYLDVFEELCQSWIPLILPRLQFVSFNRVDPRNLTIL
jgi:hypothetical protein